MARNKPKNKLKTESSIHTVKIEFLLNTVHQELINNFTY